MYRPSSFRQLPEVVKNLLIINGLLFLAKVSLKSREIDLTQILGLHQFQSPDFMPHQLITHFFMHANFTHLLVNMFALWMFGKVLENVWGGKRFLIYYMFTGLGAAALHLGVIQYQIFELSNGFPELIKLAKQYNVKIQVGHVERYNPAYIEASKIISEQAVQELSNIPIGLP